MLIKVTLANVVVIITMIMIVATLNSLAMIIMMVIVKVQRWW